MYQLISRKYRRSQSCCLFIIVEFLHYSWYNSWIYSLYVYLTIERYFHLYSIMTVEIQTSSFEGQLWNTPRRMLIV